MTTEEFIIALFCEIDDRMPSMTKHPQAKQYPSELVTIGLLFALKGGYFRAFYRWLKRDFDGHFGGLPHRTRLQRLLYTHREWCQVFLAEASFFTVIDSYGIELIHPIREGRSDQQIGKKGKSNWRWIVGGKLCFVLNHLGLIVAWECDTANVYDGSAFQHLVEQLQEEMLLFADMGFAKVDWQPTNLRLCHRGEWNVRMVVETVFSMLTYVCHFKHMAHKSWDYFESHLGYAMALFNLLVEWHGLQPDDYGFVHLSIAEFSL